MSALRSSFGSTQALPGDGFDRSIPRTAGLQTHRRRLAVDLVVNVRATGAGTALAAPLLLSSALDGAPLGLAVAALLSWFSGSYLRLSATTRL
ncbi:hypothetical protein ACFWP2_28940 [Kitasatospora sp. NPDC058444]|uniref:hypothetical protein n=1 Tax=Kitasatospora sp. NPDC058444 TaxID=3346504 RepID=UPI0036628BED